MIQKIEGYICPETGKYFMDYEEALLYTESPKKVVFINEGKPLPKVKRTNKKNPDKRKYTINRKATELQQTLYNLMQDGYSFEEASLAQIAEMLNISRQRAHLAINSLKNNFEINFPYIGGIKNKRTFIKKLKNIDK